VGFFTRPIGAWVIGRIGDRKGRKPAMILSFSLTGIAITGLALTPTHARIGVAAPVLVIFFRLLQGFALGGEVGPSTAYLMEAAPPERRGFYTSFQSWSQHLSVLISGLVGFGLANILSPQQLQDYGWRIAFLLGVAIVPLGVVMRRSMPETFHAAPHSERQTATLRPLLWVAVPGVLLLASATIGNYIANYMTTYVLAILHMPVNAAFAATVVVGLSGVSVDLVSGALSDRFGRKPMMLIPAGLLLVLIFPGFYTIEHFRTTATLLTCTAALAILMSACACPIVVWLTESLPASIRSSGMALIYAVSIATFGGTTQYVVTWLIKVTGNSLAPAWYWIVAEAVGLIAMSVIRESAPRKLPGFKFDAIGANKAVGPG
jgi:MFS family permease